MSHFIAQKKKKKKHLYILVEFQSVLLNILKDLFPENS